MNDNLVFPSDNITEEQAKAEVQRLTVEINRTLEQIKRERETNRYLGSQTDATLARINEGLKQMLAR